MNRFFIDPALISGSSVSVPDDVSAQIRKVLRLKDGSIVEFLDNNGWVYESRISYLSEKQICAEILRKTPAHGEPGCSVTLCIGLTQREKFEWILQKCTEAGVTNIIPMITERSLIRKPADIISKKERWEKILKEASEQCGRGRIPRLCQPMSFQQAAEYGAKSSIALICWEQEKTKTLHEAMSPVLKTAKDISIIVGPEGGISEDEAGFAIKSGWVPVTLGKRIYRMETAALVSVVLALYEMENACAPNMP